jgi:hypothetical protein
VNERACVSYEYKGGVTKGSGYELQQTDPTNTYIYILIFDTFNNTLHALLTPLTKYDTPF